MSYSDKQKDEIFEIVFKRVAEGEAVRNILLEPEFPSSKTFYKWLEEDEVKVKHYTHACKIRAENIFDEILTIADDEGGDVIMKDGVEITNNNVINRAKLRIDARKWVLGKLNPSKYGDRVQNDITVNDKRKDVNDIFPPTDDITD
tara:strand:- start:36738 stop:37175 length:438 start_codon:yes stop_codon:yes gene_type:complete